MLYIGIGALAAVGAGYLVWKYALNDETKERAKKTMKEAVRMGSELAENAAQEAAELGHEAADSAIHSVRAARRALSK